jgi:hypothetical protein
MRIEVLSNRADLISGGDALVAIDLPVTIDPSQVRVTRNGQDITDRFAVRPNDRFEGLVTGLDIGDNVLSATTARGRSVSVTVVDHANGGPLFSGPQIKPWTCQTGAIDAQCDQAVTYSFMYKHQGDSSWSAYDPQNPPSGVGTVTTDDGKSVPDIVRLETGYQDRDQYQIAVLYDPSKPWAPWAPQDGWDGKLLITHGALCGTEHQSGTAPAILDEPALERGMAVMSTALDNAGHNCNLAVEAESLVMAKERVVEQYGPIRYTIGTGCSGGSLALQQVANAYPGIYQGIVLVCSFPDAWSSAQHLLDDHLTLAYLDNPMLWAPGVVWDPASMGAVDGHPNHANGFVFDSSFWAVLTPDATCAGVAAAQTYNSQTNPGGTRCGLADYMMNVLGPRQPGDWGSVEQGLGHGFAGLPIDNVGVQYGLDALRAGRISPAQFVDLNAKIGGLTIDLKPQAARLAATEPALRNAYASGAINSANNMDAIPIIDVRGPDVGTVHDAYRSWAVRARMERDQGHFPRNDVIWFMQSRAFTPFTSQGTPDDAVQAVDRWLNAVEQDHRDTPLAEKVATDRPADIQDKCSDEAAVEQVDVPGVGKVCQLSPLETKFGTPRTVAGESIATDTNKCELKPLARSDYYPTAFTDDQWSQLEATFPAGVCDWSKPGVDQVGTTPWQTYQSDPAGLNVVYGGTPLGPAPGDSGMGWSSQSFSSWRQATAGGQS